MTSESWALEIANWDWVLWSVVTVVAVLGVFASYLRRYLQGAVTTGLGQYLQENARNTVISLVTLLSALWVQLGAGLFDGIGLFVTITNAFSMGFGIDTVANGNKTVSKIKRKAKQEEHSDMVRENKV